MVLSLTKDERDYLCALLDNERGNCIAQIQEGDEWCVDNFKTDLEHIKNIQRKMKKG